jgi:TolA-binding protein
MSVPFSFRTITMSLFLVVTEISLVSLVSAQRPDARIPSANPGSLAVVIAVRDIQGTPPQTRATVRLYSTSTGYEVSTITGGTSDATFSVPPGDYTVEVRCDGYQPARDEVTVSDLGTEAYLMVMLLPARDVEKNRAAKGVVMTPQLQKIVAKGLDAMHARDCDLAEKQFQKGVQMAPGNPELAFLLGTAEFCLQHTDLARKNFERTVNLDPSHEGALLSLGEMQLSAKETTLAIETLEKAQSVNASDWRVHVVLANAYWRVGHRLSDAEAQAALAVQLTNNKNGSARLLLGEIQNAQGNTTEARKTWQKLIDDLPSDSAAATAKHKLESSAPVSSIPKSRLMS